jgi:osmotically-inducible protein OsmY
MSATNRYARVYSQNLPAKRRARNSLIHVNVDKGVAELSGPIFDERERQAALVAAENIAGVMAVTDHLLWVEPLSGMMIDPLA